MLPIQSFKVLFLSKANMKTSMKNDKSFEIRAIFSDISILAILGPSIEGCRNGDCKIQADPYR